MTVQGYFLLQYRFDFLACSARTLGEVFQVVTITSLRGLVFIDYDATIVLIADGLLWAGLLHLELYLLIIISFIFSLHLLVAIAVAAISINASSDKEVVAKLGHCFAQV